MESSRRAIVLFTVIACTLMGCTAVPTAALTMSPTVPGSTLGPAGNDAVAADAAEPPRTILRVLVGVDGAPQKVELKSSSGEERFDKASIDAASGWRYVPGKRNGVPEAMWMDIPVTFRSRAAGNGP